jgi:hypothetical protein
LGSCGCWYLRGWYFGTAVVLSWICGCLGSRYFLGWYRVTAVASSRIFWAASAVCIFVAGTLALLWKHRGSCGLQRQFVSSMSVLRHCRGIIVDLLGCLGSWYHRGWHSGIAVAYSWIWWAASAVSFFEAGTLAMLWYHRGSFGQRRQLVSSWLVLWRCRGIIVDLTGRLGSWYLRGRYCGNAVEASWIFWAAWAVGIFEAGSSALLRYYRGFGGLHRQWVLAGKAPWRCGDIFVDLVGGQLVGA